MHGHAIMQELLSLSLSLSLLVDSKFDIRDLRGPTKFIAYKQDPLLPTLIFVYEILEAKNLALVIFNLVEINIHEEDSLSFFPTLNKRLTFRLIPKNEGFLMNRK